MTLRPPRARAFSVVAISVVAILAVRLFFLGLAHERFFVAATHTHISSKMDFVAVASICALLINKKRSNKRKRQYWMHPVLSKRLIRGQFYTLYEDLRSYPDTFFSYFRVTMGTFDQLMTIIKPAVQHQDTNMIKCISAEERLIVTPR